MIGYILYLPMKGPEGIYTVTTEKKQKMIIHLFNEDDRRKEQKILFSIPVMIMSSISKQKLKNNNNFIHFTIEEESLFGDVGIYCTIDSIKIQNKDKHEITSALCYIYPLESRWEIHNDLKSIDKELRANQRKIGEYIKSNYKLQLQIIEKIRVDPKIRDLMFKTNEIIKLDIIEPKIGRELRKVTIKL